MSRAAAGSLLRHADFLKLWTGETISQLGTQVTLLAMPLVAIKVLDASAFQVGVLSAVEYAPFLLVGLFAGVWVDRMRRRPILILSDVGRALVLASVPVTYALHVLTLPQLYAVAFVLGVLTVFFDVAYQSYLPALVDRSQILDGNAKLEMSRSGAAIAGPGLAGALVGLLSAPTAIAADALSYVGSVLSLLLIRRREPPVTRPVGGHPGMRREIAEGLRYVFGHPLLRPIAVCTATLNLFGNMGQAILVLYAVRTLGLGAGTIGGVLSAGNVAFLAGAVLAGRIGVRLGVGRAIIAAAMLSGAGALLVPLASATAAVPLLIAASAVGAFGGVVYNINQVSLRQAITPARLQGRMNATMRFVVWGTIPVGALVGGALGGVIGLRPTLWIAAAGGTVFGALPVLLSPVRVLRRIPDAEPVVAVTAGAAPVAAAPR